MSAPFTENEKNIIREQLRESAKECMCKYGIKKTTVDELVQRAGISKGAFYKFYDSKELLFFDVIECFHKEFYDIALTILQERSDLNEKERAEKAILAAFKFVQKSPLVMQIESEMPYLLRKIPEDKLKEHFEHHDLDIQKIINASGITLSISPDFIYAAIRALETLCIHKESVGNAHFEELMEIFIKGICERIFHEERS